MPALGVTASNFVCSNTGTTGVCQGTNQPTQQAFYALQNEINRVGRSFGVTKVAVDGKIGPKTLSALLMVVDRLYGKLGGHLDQNLMALIIEVDGAPTAPRDVALNAVALTAALKREGAADAPWSPVATVQDAVHQAVDNIVTAVTAPPAPVWPGNGAPALPPAGQPINPYATPPVAQAFGMPIGLKIGLGVAACAVIGGLTAALLAPRRRPAAA